MTKVIDFRFIKPLPCKMKTFFLAILKFCVPLMAFIFLGLLLPPSPRARTSIFFARFQKDSLLAHAESPRLILIGGSNITMSINSRIIRDSLGVNPINAGLSASVGLFYMLDRTLHHIKDGDVIIISPEYSQFYDGLSYGTEDLIRIVFDTAPAEVFKLRRKQLLNSLQYVPKYSLAKLKIWRYWLDKSDTAEVYVRTSFNEFGDLTKHWKLPPRPFEPLALLKRTDYDPEVVESLKNFQEAARAKGASVFITFPALHEQSYQNEKQEIQFIDAELRKNNLAILGNPSRYRVNTELMFDSPYHLTQKGVTTRTEMLVNDLREAAKGKELEFLPGRLSE